MTTLTDEQIARMRANASATVAHDQPVADAAAQHARDVLALVEEVSRWRRIAVQLDEELRHATARHHDLLIETDRLRHQRIVVLGDDRGGDCHRCMAGSFSVVSASTDLYERPADGVVVAITGVPVIECDVCGEQLVTMDVARVLERLRDHAEATPADRDQVVRLDWRDR